MSVSALLLRLEGPLQSWGDRPAIDDRMTGSVPTKSGVIGLLAAALGLERGPVPEHLLELRMGVRVDQRGRRLVDYHTVSNYEWIGPNALQPKNLPNSEVNAAGRQKSRTGKTPMTTIPTRRYYLQDAVFVVGLEGAEEYLRMLDEAVRWPMYPLALGRRSCPPAGRVSVGLRSGKSLWEILEREPWQAGVVARRAKERETGESRRSVDLEFHVEDGEGEPVRDVPVSFAPSERAWATRLVQHDFRAVETGLAGEGAAADREQAGLHSEATQRAHDPLDW